MIDLEIEYMVVTELAERKCSLLRQLAEIDDQLKKHSHHFYVADDGLVEVGLGVL